MYDGPDSSSPQMEQLSGSLAAGEVSTTTMTSTSNSMDLVFTSDESIGAGGFVVNYQCASGKATLDFTEFATESDYDFVTVYDGADASAPKLGELSGALVDILDTHFDAGSDVLLVEFTSDESITDGGFQARYTCG